MSIKRDFAVAIDGDDTLWVTMPLYTAAKNDIAARLATLGLPPKEYLRFSDVIDIERLKDFGFIRSRYAGSMTLAYEQMCEKYNLSVDASVSAWINQRVEEIFTTPAPLMEGAREMLETLRPHARLALVTKGDPSVQEPRIATSGLGEYFDSIHIVPDKDEAVYQSVFDSVGVSPSRSWSLGNSVPSDVLPAVACGATGIWIQTDSWHYEKRIRLEDGHEVHKVRKLRSATRIIARGIRQKTLQEERRTPAL